MEAFVEIKAKLAPLRKGLARAKALVGKAMATMQKAIDKMVSVAKKAFIGLAAAMGVATWAAMKQEDVLERLSITLKATGHAAGFTKKQLAEQAVALQKVTRFGDETIIAMQTMLLTFKNIKGDVFKRATEAALDMATAEASVSGRAVDLTATIIRLGRALNDPIEGMSALTRVGVKFTDEQKILIETFTKSGRVSKAQAVILKELQSEFGGMARDVNTASGALKQMWNALGDIMEVIGQPFLDNIKRTAQGIRDWAYENQVSIGEFAAAFDRLIEVGVNVMVKFMTPMVKKLTQLTKKFSGFVTEAKLEATMWAIGEWTEKIWLRVKELYNFLADLWKQSEILNSIKYMLELAYAQFEQWGKQLYTFMTGLGDIVASGFANKFALALAKRITNLLSPSGLLGKLLSVSPVLNLLKLGLGKAAGGLIKASTAEKPESISDLLARVSQIQIRTVTMPAPLARAIFRFSDAVREGDDQIEEKWRQLQAEFENTRSMKKVVEDFDASLGGPGKEAAPRKRQVQLGFAGFREAWSRMVTGMKDPMTQQMELVAFYSQKTWEEQRRANKEAYEQRKETNKLLRSGGQSTLSP